MNIEKLNNDKDLKIYNLDYINTIGYECEQGVVYFNHDSLEYEINRGSCMYQGISRRAYAC